MYIKRKSKEVARSNIYIYLYKYYITHFDIKDPNSKSPRRNIFHPFEGTSASTFLAMCGAWNPTISTSSWLNPWFRMRVPSSRVQSWPPRSGPSAPFQRFLRSFFAIWSLFPSIICSFEGNSSHRSGDGWMVKVCSWLKVWFCTKYLETVFASVFTLCGCVCGEVSVSSRTFQAKHVKKPTTNGGMNLKSKSCRPAGNV